MRVRIQSKSGHKIVDLNRRKAIWEKCLNCSGWCRNDVYNCSITECWLYPFSSGKGRQDAKARATAIRKYCLDCMGGKRAQIAKCSSPDCPLFPYRNSKVDRSIQIKPISKKGLIEGDLDTKIQNEGHSMHKMDNLDRRHVEADNSKKKRITKSSIHHDAVERSKMPESQAEKSGPDRIADSHKGAAKAKNFDDAQLLLPFK